MTMLPVLLLGVIITAGTFAAVEIDMPEDWPPYDDTPCVIEADFIGNMVQVYLESLRRNEVICQDEEDRIWQKLYDCHEVTNDQELVESLKDWDVMTEFIELAVTRTRDYSFHATLSEYQPMAIFKRLTPVRFWRILQDVPFPVADKMHFRLQKRATVQILENVCKMYLPDEIKDKIAMAEIRDVFFSMVIKTYLEDSISDDSEEILRSATRTRDLRCEWEKIAFNALHYDSVMKTTCIDPLLKDHTERPCIQEIRTIAADLGVEGCEMELESLELTSSSFSFAPTFGENDENEEAPQMQPSSNGGAPSGPQGRSGQEAPSAYF